MAEAVDSIIAELIVKNEAYVRGFNEATAAHQRFLKSTDQLKSNTFDLQAEGQKYKAGADKIGQAESQLTEVVKKARKSRADAVKQSAKEEVTAEKQAADERRRLLEQAARDEERLRQAVLTSERRSRAQALRDARSTTSLTPVSRGVTVAPNLFSEGGGVQRGSGALLGTTDVGARSVAARQTEIMRQTRVEAEQVAVAEAEINHEMVEQVRLQAGLLAARGEDRRLIREQISDMRTYNQLLKTGLSEEAAAVELDKIRVARARELAVQEGAHTRAQASQFAAGAGLGRFGGLNAATAGIGLAAGAAAGVAAISSSLDFAKEIKNTADAVGLTTKQVQVYEAAARQAGVSTDQFRSGIGQLSSYLGRAKEGDEQAAKTFKALGINIKEASSAGDILPTLIDRISSIADPAQRAAVETRLFGEEGRRLDALLSGGNEKIGQLADALERTGAILSSGDIAKLNDTENKLAQVKAQLQVDLAQVVAGNADAILKLADAFAAVANAAGSAVRAYEQFQNSGVGKAASFLNPLTAPTRIGNALGNGINRLLGRNPGAKSNSLGDLSDSASEFLKSQPGSVGDLSGLFAPKGPKGKSANQLAAEAEARTKRFNDQLAQYQEQELRAQAEATGSVQERAAFESQLAERQRNRQIADINSQRDININHGANREIEEARARILRDAVTQATATSEATREAQVERDLRSQANQNLQARLQIEGELLASAEPLARTSKDRLAIQLRLLDIEKQQEKAALETQLANAKPGEDTTATRARLGSLDARYAGRAADARESNLGPLAAYARTLPQTANEVGEAFENAAARGIEDVNSALDRSIAKALKLHGLAGQIASTFLNAALQSAAGSLFGGLLGGGGGGLGGVFKGVGHLFGFADGGSGVIQGNPGVDRNVLSINGSPVARVSAGERLAIVPPNIGTAGGRVAARNTTVVQQTIHVDGRNSVTPEGFAGQILDEADRRARTYSTAAYNGALQGAPSRVRYVQQSEG